MNLNPSPLNYNFDIVILTDKRYLKDSKTDTYKHNVYYEDFLVQEALKDLGLRTLRLAWDDADFDWNSTASVLFRTTWDYFDRFEEFSKWLSKVSKQTRLFNSEKIIRWNIDKHYLQDLQSKNIQVAESFFIEKGNCKSLIQHLEALEWNEVVLKPCISGAGRHTYKFNRETANEYEVIFQKLIAGEAMMLQPFQKDIVETGEVSMMLFNGEFTHAVLKKAKPGDFRVQDDFGGTVHDYQPTKAEITFAIKAVNACPEMPIYARVDIFKDNNGKLALSELELIEPELWFRNFPKASEVLARSVLNYLY